MTMKSSTSRNAFASELMATFLAELSLLSVSSKIVTKLGRPAIAKSFAHQDSGLQHSRARVLRLMNDIEDKFEIIRAKLLS